ncbi:MAG: lysophospholipid acyltransferase family protein [Pseudomonadota bacterium]|nr:lysophospholipid acyltransferase family protein [Pseudomonadota bacterium]
MPSDPFLNPDGSTVRSRLMEAVLHALTRIPLSMLYGLGWGAYILAFEVFRWRRNLARANLRGAFPEKSESEIDALLRQSYRNLGTMIAEAVHGFGATREQMRQCVHFENAEVPLQYIRAGRSIVLLAGHFCNWEWLLTGSAARLTVPINAVYKPQRTQAVDRFLRKARTRFGGNPIPVRTFLHEVMRRRHEARIYALVADQTPMRHEDKHWTVFLHRDTAFYTGAGKIARLLGAPVIFVAMHRTARGQYNARFEVLAEPPYCRESDSAVIEAYARALEREIRTSPADWLWVHRKWKYPKPETSDAPSHAEETPVN